MENTGPSVILGIYIALLIAGGLMGFIKAKSKASIITSSLFAVLLVITEFVLHRARLSDLLLFVLLAVFAFRYGKGRKFMPAGLMAILSLAVLILRFLVT